MTRKLSGCPASRLCGAALLLIGASLCLAAPDRVQTEVLASATVSGEQIGLVQLPHEALAIVGFRRPYFVALFEDLVMVPSDAGRVFEATSGVDPDFDDFVVLLTNGQQDGMIIGGGINIVAQERSEKAYLNLPTTDLAGFQIDRVTLRPTQLDFIDPNEHGGTTLRFTYVVKVWGSSEQVPTHKQSWGLLKALYTATE